MVGIIGAMEPEVILLRNLLKNVKTQSSGGFELYEGNLDGKDVALLRCGIGKVNAAVGCALLVDKYHPDLVINTGSAGGIGAGLNIGDAVISDGLIHHDADVTAFNYEPGQLPGMPAVFPVPENLITTAERAVDELKQEGILPAGFNHVRGIIGSGDVFMHDPQRIAAASARFPKMRAVEMESAAVAQTCWLFHVPCLVIRALSDIAGAESSMSFDEFLPIASKNSCEIVRRIIKLYK
ncbi:MAG: 5'-methylthioadenosine/S-adenosylhomocysteine nucleosidase [Spirochaetaceae bacterium]|jgi:adenosylhomocysteine nucleosidase|nr:5'-methylthioadenosine/S-adenosylhomocysteine nucleosidase [Spirochaetaceae bacterium]